MASITTRAGKGSPLTNAEVDANFTNLNTELLGKQDALGFTPFSTAGGQISGNTGIGAAAAVNARLRVVGSGTSPEVARIEGGTVEAQHIINQTDDPAVNTSRAQLSLRKNNIVGATIGIDGSAANRGIVYYDAYSATGSHAFYVNSTDRFRINSVGAVSFSSAYGTAGQLLKSGGSGAAPTWGSLTSGEVTTALGYTPLAPSAIGSTVQAYDADLAAIAALAPTADNFIVGNGTAWTLETPAQARTSLGLVNGTNVQAWDGALDAIAALAGTSGFLKKTAANTWSLDTNTYLTGNQSITFTGDATGSGATSVALTLANSGVTAGTYGSATNIPQIAVDAKGRITSVSNVAVSIPSGSLTFTGDVTGSGSTGSSTSLTLANSGVTAGTYTKVTVDAKGRVTTGASLASADLPTYTGTLTSSQVTTALGFTPYNSTNPSGYITASSSDVLTNKQVVARVVAIADGTSITVNADTTDIATQTNTQVAGTLTINAPTGTPVNGQKLMLRLTSTNVQTFAWNAAFAGSTDVALPTASTGSGKYDYLGFIYNSTAAKWQLIAKNFGF